MWGIPSRLLSDHDDNITYMSFLIGDIAFCSEECRTEQMEADEEMERKEKGAPAKKLSQRPPSLGELLVNGDGGGGGKKKKKEALKWKWDLAKEKSGPGEGDWGRVRGEAAEEEDDGEFGATDTRMGVMAIISFLPYFNWLLEAGIRNGDIEGFMFFQKAQNLLFPNAMKEKDGHRAKKRESLRTGHRGNSRIPSAHESREKLRNSDIFKKKLDEPDEQQKKSDWH
ncbi:hypothetical protein TRIUR3_27923 [Triticum urartu]|uniref:Uncharacterized protein n=1 Tax=Triticum urartu TaxID=4572 RepID=M7ZTU0_TRIUA|nr:hypothetical protein TRIUR3_27923 [Triticum urartu]